MVEPHGGHFWSTQGQIRPLDITSLRIDQQERMTLQLATTLISPTHYMTAYLRQRGWKLPTDRQVSSDLDLVPHVRKLLVPPVWCPGAFGGWHEGVESCSA